MDETLMPQQVIALIAQVSASVGCQAGVGAMETAGSIVSYLHAHPEQIGPFMSGIETVMDWPIGWHEQGCLSWHGRDGKIYTPEFARQHRIIKQMEGGNG